MFPSGKPIYQLERKSRSIQFSSSSKPADGNADSTPNLASRSQNCSGVLKDIRNQVDAEANIRNRVDLSHLNTAFCQHDESRSSENEENIGDPASKMEYILGIPKFEIKSFKAPKASLGVRTSSSHEPAEECGGGAGPQHLGALTHNHQVKLDKGLLKMNKYIGQVDKKYLVSVCEEEGMLLMWDQHALHERIRLEKLISSCTFISESGSRSVKKEKCSDVGLKRLTSHQAKLLKSNIDAAEAFGLQFSGCVITEIPTCFLHIEPERQIRLTKHLVEELVEHLESGAPLPLLPKTVHDLLCSLACRGAIMFGETVDFQNGQKLIKEIAKCQSPFQCAHGRPSVVPAIDLKTL